jgi:hypothetical protein
MAPLSYLIGIHLLFVYWNGYHSDFREQTATLSSRYLHAPSLPQYWCHIPLVKCGKKKLFRGPVSKSIIAGVVEELVVKIVFSVATFANSL